MLKKISVLLLVLFFLIPSSSSTAGADLSSIGVPKVKAASSTINYYDGPLYWGDYYKGLRDFLWDYRGTTGKCNDRAPHKGACLTPKIIIQTLRYLEDPNRDGDKGDSFFNATTDSERRRWLLRPACTGGATTDCNPVNKFYHPFILSARVRIFEDKWNTTLTGTSTTSDVVNTATEKLRAKIMKKLENPTRPTPGFNMLPGDGALEQICFAYDPNAYDGSYPIGQDGPAPWFTLIPKDELTSTELDIVYHTQRMSGFISHKDERNWTTGAGSETEALMTLVNNQAKAIEICKKNHWTPTEQRKLQKAATETMKEVGINLVLGAVDALMFKGGMIVAEKAKPVEEVITAGERTAIIGGKSFEVTGPTLRNMTQTSRTLTTILDEPGTATFMENGYKKVAKGFDVIFEQNKRFFPTGTNTNMIEQLKKRTFFASKSTAKALGKDESVVGWTPYQTNEIFYSDDLLMGYEKSRLIEPFGHEVAHWQRAALARQYGWFDELAAEHSILGEPWTSWVTVKSYERAGYKAFALVDLDRSGYYGRKFFQHMAERIAKKLPVGNISMSITDAEDMLIAKYWSGSAKGLDDIFGERFNGAFFSKLAEYEQYEMALKAAKQTGGLEAYAQAMKAQAQKSKEIFDFIDSREINVN